MSAPGAPASPRPATVAASQERCLTCSDQALAVRVLDLLGDGLARVEREGAEDTVNVDLVDAAAGDVLLVHAGVAIGKLGAERRGSAGRGSPGHGAPGHGSAGHG